MSTFRQQHMAVNWHDIVYDDSEEIIPAKNASLHDKASLVGRMGYLLLGSGSSAWRVRAVMNKISRALGIICNADIGLLTIEYTCVENGEFVTGALSLPTTGVNTDRINALEDFANGFAQRTEKYSAEQFHRILDNIVKTPPNYNAWQLGLASGAACCAFTYLLEGGPVEMICAFFGAGIGNFIRKKMLEKHITLVGNVSIAVASACVVYVLLLKLAEHLFGFTEMHQAGYICSMLFIIPGFPLITGGMDLAKLELRSGIERLLYACIIIVTATITGWITATIFRFQPGDLPTPEMHFTLRMAFRIVASFVGVYGFSLMFNSPHRVALTAALIGMTVNTIRLELLEFTPIPVAPAAFVGTFLAGLIASAIREKIGFHRITLTVPSVVIMVPGMFMYKAFYFLGHNDITEGTLWLSKAFLILFALPFGLICARIISDKNYRLNS